MVNYSDIIELIEPKEPKILESMVKFGINVTNA